MARAASSCGAPRWMLLFRGGRSAPVGRSRTAASASWRHCRTTPAGDRGPFPAGSGSRAAPPARRRPDGRGLTRNTPAIPGTCAKSGSRSPGTLPVGHGNPAATPGGGRIGTGTVPVSQERDGGTVVDRRGGGYPARPPGRFEVMVRRLRRSPALPECDSVGREGQRHALRAVFGNPQNGPPTRPSAWPGHQRTIENAIGRPRMRHAAGAEVAAGQPRGEVGARFVPGATPEGHRGRRSGRRCPGSAEPAGAPAPARRRPGDSGIAEPPGGPAGSAAMNSPPAGPARPRRRSGTAAALPSSGVIAGSRRTHASQKLTRCRWRRDSRGTCDLHVPPRTATARRRCTASEGYRDQARAIALRLMPMKRTERPVCPFRRAGTGPRPDRFSPTRSRIGLVLPFTPTGTLSLDGIQREMPRQVRGNWAAEQAHRGRRHAHRVGCIAAKGGDGRGA